MMFCWYPLPIAVATPAEGRGGCSGMTEERMGQDDEWGLGRDKGQRGVEGGAI